MEVVTWKDKVIQVQENERERAEMAIQTMVCDNSNAKLMIL